MTAVKEINIMDLMNRNFYSFWLNEKPHSILSGGRSSMKSSVISLKLVMDFLDDDDGNVVCLRKVGKYLSGSVYEQIKWAIYMRSEEHTSELQSRFALVCRLLLHKKNL